MQSKNYRYDCLDHTGELHDVEYFCAGNDVEDIARIQAKHPDDKCEIGSNAGLWRACRPLAAELGPCRTP